MAEKHQVHDQGDRVRPGIIDEDATDRQYGTEYYQEIGHRRAHSKNRQGKAIEFVEDRENGPEIGN